MKYVCTSCGCEVRHLYTHCPQCTQEGTIECRCKPSDAIEPESGILWRTLFFRYKDQALEKERAFVAELDRLAKELEARA